MDEEPTKKIGKRRTHGTTPRHLEQLIKKTRALAGEDEPKDVSLEDITKAVASLQERHLQLQQRLTSGSEKLASARLRQEFDDAHADVSSAYELNDNSWTDEFFREFFEQAKESEGSLHARICNSSTEVYKIMCGLKGGSIGIQYDTMYAGNPCESYYVVLAGSSNPVRVSVSLSEHTIPFFLPYREAAEHYLPSNVTKFIDFVGDMLQSYVSRREQIRVFKDLHGPKIKHITSSILCDTADFMVEEQHCKLTVNLAYKVESTVPAQAKVLAYTAARGTSQVAMSPSGSKPTGGNIISLIYAENILKTDPLPDAYEKIVDHLNSVFGRTPPADGVLVLPPPES